MGTTLFNFYVDEERGDTHTDTVRLFVEIAAGKYEAYTSDYVIDELSLTPDNKREKMTGAINTLHGYRAVEIVSPMEVIEDEIL